MFIGVETDDPGEANVTFRHISEVLADARLTAGDLAARGHDGAHNLGPVTSGANATGMQDGMSSKGMGGGTPVREDADVPPRRSNPRGQVRATENGKGRGTVKATAVQSRSGDGTRGGVARTEYYRTPVLVWVNEGMRGASRRQNRAYPSPASRSPLVIVAGRHLT